jgi:hypothetical protein
LITDPLARASRFREAHANTLFAIVLVAIGIMVLTGHDKRIETFAVKELPQWLRRAPIDV